MDLADGLGPDEAAVIAVLRNPDLIALRSSRGEAQAQVVAAGILPNPVLSGSFDHPFGVNSAGASNAWSVSLEMALKPFVARGAKRSAAKAGVTQIDLGIAWQEWVVAGQARLLVVRLGWLRRRLKLAREELDFQTHAADSMKKASVAGDQTIDQVGVQVAAVENVRRTVNELEQTELTSESDLIALLGEPNLERIQVETPQDPKLAGGSFPSVSECLTRRIDIRALRYGYRSQDEATRAAVLDQFPAVNVGISYQRDETPLSFVGAFVSVELPVFDRNQAQVASAEATRTRLMREYDARVIATRVDIDRLSRFSTLIAKQLPAVRAAIPSLEAIESKEQAAVAEGNLSQLEYQTVRAALLEQKLQEAALSQALAEARITATNSCGGPG